MSTITFIGVLVIAMTQFSLQNNRFTATEILNQYIPQNKWMVAAFAAKLHMNLDEKEQKKMEEKATKYLCKLFTFVPSDYEITCSSTVKNTAAGGLHPSEMNVPEDQDTFIAITVSADTPESFEEAVFGTKCIATTTNPPAYDSLPMELTLEHIIFVRAKEETARKFGIDVSGHALVVFVQSYEYDVENKTFGSGIITQGKQSQSTVQNLIQMYKSVYIDQVPEIMVPKPITQCYAR